MDLQRLADLDFADKHVTVVGLGIEGIDAVRFLARRGAAVTVSDSKPRESLEDRLRDVDGLVTRLALGSNDPRDIAGAEAVLVSQSVPLDLPGLQQARERGVIMRSTLGLFLELCTGPSVGITGSSGKTTTTALLGEMFQADERPHFVGGNIGLGLLDRLECVRPYTWAVLEISHTQLQLVDRSPHVAAVLNITPNHLDRFSWEAYRKLKANIIRFQGPADTAVLNHDDPESRALAPAVKGQRVWFSLSDGFRGDGVLVKDGWAIARFSRLRQKLFPLSDVRVRGRHNQANAVAAAAIAMACGISPDAITCAVQSFRGVPHRLEEVGEVNSVRYVNDSIATTPERTLAGLLSFQEPLVLLLGGRDKHLPLEDLVREASARCRAVLLFGEAAGKLEDAFRAADVAVKRAPGLPEAVEAARTVARPGDAVLLSPACTSYDAYENFEQRGNHFRELVRAMIREVQPSLP